MVIRANACINLALNVLGKNENGLHDVDMISIPIDLHDVLEAKHLIGTADTFLTEDDPTIICDETNLAYKAFTAMKKAFVMNKGARIQIFKRIPSEAGLGGGYADAAAVIEILCRMYGLDPTSPKVIEVANSVSVNIARFLLNVPMRAKGRGEEMYVFPDLQIDYGVLIVKPNQGLDTKRVFEAFDALPEEERAHPDIEKMLKALLNNNGDLDPELLGNTLMKPAMKLCPQIGMVLDDMRKLGIKLCLMSGTGSGCFGLSRDQKLLEQAQHYFEEKGLATLLSSTKVVRHRPFDPDFNFSDLWKKTKAKVEEKRKNKVK